MDDYAPEVKTMAKEKNRRRTIILATLLVLAIIAAVAVILCLSTKARTSSDDTGLLSGNTSSESTRPAQSQGEVVSRTLGYFLNSTLPTTDAESTPSSGTPRTSFHIYTTQSASTYISTEPDGNSGQHQSVLDDSSTPTVDTTLVTQVSNATDLLEVTHKPTTSTLTSNGRRAKKVHSSKQDASESVLDNWYPTGNTSYTYKVYKELKSFNEAEKTCQSVKSKLASTGVRNGNAKSKIVNIISEIRETVKGVKPYVWIGMRINSTNSTDWEWSDGYIQTEETVGFWGADQPDRIKRGVIEMCVAISTKLDPVKNETGLLHDCPCEKHLPFICEKKNIPDTEP